MGALCSGESKSEYSNLCSNEIENEQESRQKMQKVVRERDY